MKKLISLMLVLALALSLAACAQPAAEEAAPVEEVAGEAAPELVWNPDDVQGSIDAAVAATEGKIAIITNTVSQNEEEYRSAQAMVEKYGDRVIHDTMPDNFMAEQEQFISVINKYGTDPDVKAIIINQACPGSNPGIDKVAEVRDLNDLFVAYCTPQENPTDITTRADVTISVDEVGKGTYMAQQAYDMGCKTFVHYSFPRHMAQVTLAGCRDKIKEKCEELGIEFVDATAPDPTSDAGTTGAQMFILEDVPKMVEKYGKETAFFSTNCSMQVPLIEAVYDSGAYFVQPCCPSPYHGFPSAFGIESPSDLVNGITETIEASKKYVADAGLTGHFSTWSVPASIANTVACTEYAFLWMAGLAPDCDSDILAALLGNYCGTEAALEPFVDPGTGEVTENYLVYQLGYLTY